MQAIKPHFGTSKVVFMGSCLLGLIQGAYVYAAPVPELGTCPAIKNDTQRLACYDQLAGTIKPAPPLGEPVAAVQPVSTDLAKTSLLSRRWELDDADKHGTYQFRPHHANYLLPLKYSNAPNNAPFRGNLLQPEHDLDSVEAKLQLSFKVKAAEGLFNKSADLWFGYTVTSYWQAYNSGVSAPFRETDYEPEAMLVFRTDYDIAGLKGRFINLGLVHQSNGRSVALSRSWNRVYAQFGFERGDFALLIRPWYRIPESAANDNNPDIKNYMGSGDLVASYSKGGNTYSVLLRNNLKSTANRGALQANWSFPLHGRLQGYIQYFNGYGESLIDYNYKQQSIGIGVSLADWM
jgi:phospholipase A1